MSEPFAADDVPLMAFDRAQIEGAARQLTLAAHWIRAARAALGPADSEWAADEHDHLQRSSLEPTVRLLDTDEAHAWQDRGLGLAEQHVAADDDRELRVRIGPLDNSRWVLDAQIHHRDSHGLPGDDPTASVALSCETEQHARGLGDELLTAGPNPALLARLVDNATARTQRKADSADDVPEPDHVRMARTRREIRAAWHPPLAERVITSPAFPNLAARLHELEEHGTAMPDVLARLSQTALSGDRVRDPARLACWMCDNVLTVVDGEIVTTAQASSREATPSPRPRPAPRPQPDGVERDWLHSVDQDTVWPALRAALPEQLCQRLRGSDGYDALVRELAGKATAGWSLDTLLTRLPADEIGQAAHPARYLSAAVARRVQQDPPERTGLNKAGMAAVIREAMPPELAQKVLACPAWPALATRMARTEASARRGEPPLARLLMHLPMEAIGGARKPAAYTAQLLSRHVAARRGERPHPTSRSDLAREVSLDPASAIDRVALDDARPTLIIGPDLAAAASHLNAAEQDNTMASDAEHTAGFERTDHPDSRPAAGYETGETAAEGAAPTDDHLAAGYRAAAAEEMGSAAAAALRAQVVLTPPTAKPVSTPTVATESASTRVAGPVRTPQNSTRDRTRTR